MNGNNYVYLIYLMCEDNGNLGFCGEMFEKPSGDYNLTTGIAFHSSTILVLDNYDFPIEVIDPV